MPRHVDGTRLLPADMILAHQARSALTMHRHRMRLASTPSRALCNVPIVGEQRPAPLAISQQAIGVRHPCGKFMRVAQTKSNSNGSCDLSMHPSQERLQLNRSRKTIQASAGIDVRGQR
jgi:hypothetical protein